MGLCIIFIFDESKHLLKDAEIPDKHIVEFVSRSVNTILNMAT